MSENRAGSGGIFLGGVLLGAAVGAVAGLLFAPKTGRETRQLLRKSAEALPELAEDLSASMQLQADRLSETALRNWDDTLLRLREAISAGVDASQRQRELAQLEPMTHLPARDASMDDSGSRDSSPV